MRVRTASSQGLPRWFSDHYSTLPSLDLPSSLLLDYVSKFAILLKIVQCHTLAHSLKSELLTLLFASFCIWLHPTLPNFSFSLFYLLPTSACWPIVSLSWWREQWVALHSDTSFLSQWYANQLLWIALPNTVLFPRNAFPSSISKIYLSFKAPFKCYHCQEVFPIHLHWKLSVIGGPFYTTLWKGHASYASISGFPPPNLYMS